MRAEREKYINSLREDHLSAHARESAEQAVAAAGIQVSGREIPFSYIPLILNSRDAAFFESAVSTADRILSKVTRRYIADAEYRKLFAFSDDMEKLILLPCNYETVFPVGRCDIFFDEDTGAYQVCEFNTDGSGGMSRDYEISSAIRNSFPDRDFVTAHSLRPIPVIDHMVTRFLKIYHSDKNAVEDPMFCVTDFREEGVFSDFERFIASFRRHGVRARFTDIRDLVFDGTHLRDRTDGTIVNAIYRRAVTSSVLARLRECRGLIDAVRAEKVVLLGHFRTSVAHSKMIHVVLHHEQTMNMLSEPERQWVKEHIPFTCPLKKDAMDEELFAQILEHKDSWVLKPREGFASRGVVCGVDVSEVRWRELVAEKQGDIYLVQRFCRRYPMPVLPAAADEITEMPVMVGLYSCAGHFTGCYSRAGTGGTIDYEHGGLCVSTLLSGEILPCGTRIGCERENLRIDAGGTLSARDDCFPDEEFLTKDFGEAQTELVSPVFASAEDLHRWMSEKTELIRKRLSGLKPPELLWPFSAPAYLPADQDIRIAGFGEKAGKAETYRAYLAEKYGKRRMLFSGIHLNFSVNEQDLRCPGLSAPEQDSRWKTRFCLNAAAGYAEYGWLITFLTAASPLLDGSFFSPSEKGRTIQTDCASVRCSEAGYWNSFVPNLSFRSVDAYIDSVRRHIDSGELIGTSELYFPVRLKPEAGGDLETLKTAGIDHVEFRNIDLNPFDQTGIALSDLTFVKLFWEYLGCTFRADTQRADPQRWTANFKAAARFDPEKAPITDADGKQEPLVTCAMRLLDKMRDFFRFDGEAERVLAEQMKKITGPHLRYAEQIAAALRDDFVRRARDALREKT